MWDQNADPHSLNIPPERQIPTAKKKISSIVEQERQATMCVH